MAVRLDAPRGETPTRPRARWRSGCRRQWPGIPWVCAGGCRLQGSAFAVQCGDRAAATTLRDHVPRAAFALPALGGHTQFKLDLVETHAGTRMARDVTVRNSAADADDHGVWLKAFLNYKCESVALATQFCLICSQRLCAGGGCVVQTGQWPVPGLKIMPQCGNDLSPWSWNALSAAFGGL